MGYPNTARWSAEFLAFRLRFGSPFRLLRIDFGQNPTPRKEPLPLSDFDDGFQRALERATAAGHSKRSIARDLNAPLKSLYGAAQELRVDVVRRVCELGELTERETHELLILWLKARFPRGAMRAAIERLVRVVDELSDDDRVAVYLDAIELYVGAMKKK